MSIKQRIRNNVIAQFSNPRGTYGRIAGRIMSTRQTNVTRNAWIAEILNPPPGAHILEIGHGPGLAIEHLVPTIGDGHITGLELSPLMSQTAARRNRDAVRTGVVDFRIGDSSNPPPDLHSLDIIFGVNSSKSADAGYVAGSASSTRHLRTSPAVAMAQALVTGWGQRYDVVDNHLTEIVEPTGIKLRIRRPR